MLGGCCFRQNPDLVRGCVRRCIGSCAGVAATGEDAFDVETCPYCGVGYYRGHFSPNQAKERCLCDKLKLPTVLAAAEAAGGGTVRGGGPALGGGVGMIPDVGTCARRLAGGVGMAGFASAKDRGLAGV
jgi:hypothetical protein